MPAKCLALTPRHTLPVALSPSKGVERCGDQAEGAHLASTATGGMRPSSGAAPAECLKACETALSDSGVAAPEDGRTPALVARCDPVQIEEALLDVGSEERGVVPWTDGMKVEPWPEPVDGAALLNDLAGLVRRFLILPKWAEEALALWVLHTYAFELRDVTSYLGIESPEKRCGKTTLLAVLSELVNRPVVAANISPSAFFRVIEETRPTLLIDEADTFLQGNDELRGILNAGYKDKMAFVVRVAAEVQSPRSKVGRAERASVRASERHERCGVRQSDRQSGGRGSRLVRFSCWCPKVLAAIGRLPDTLADRCIVIRMQRKRADEECERIKNLDGGELRAKCARFVRDRGAEIAAAQPSIPEELNDRAADIWEPLLALADLAGGDWAEKARQAAVSLSTNAQENNPIGSLLMDLWFLFTKNKADRMFSRTLVENLNYFPTRPWAELTRGGNAKAPRGVTELWLAQKLRPYGVRTITMRIGDEMGKGYYYRDLEEVFRRFIPRSEVEGLKAELALMGERGSGERGSVERPPSSDFGATSPGSSDSGETGSKGKGDHR